MRPRRSEASELFMNTERLYPRHPSHTPPARVLLACNYETNTNIQLAILQTYILSQSPKLTVYKLV